MPFGKLDQLPRVRLSTAPTPLERLDRLTAANTGATLWAKRDDMQGLAFGGIGATATEELAVMMDSFRALKVAKPAMAFEDEGYFRSWLEQGEGFAPPTS